MKKQCMREGKKHEKVRERMCERMEQRWEGAKCMGSRGRIMNRESTFREDDRNLRECKQEKWNGVKKDVGVVGVKVGSSEMHGKVWERHE